ncbi:nuclear protein MDM1-like isoform X2 [Asterias amurensis]|uniref:nuclear protein MDM1-like isoform X2 n=1 Tax=Asterias amurensis TaxID=7602 RepID=UPI003AB3B0AD
MPVRNKALSEYKKKFRWHESVKSSSFKPSPEQKSSFAGLSSADLGQQEPPLQRKRYPLQNDSKLTYTTKQIFGDAPGSDDDLTKRKPRAGGGGVPVMGPPMKTFKIRGNEETGSKTQKLLRTKPDKETIKNKTYAPSSFKPGTMPAEKEPAPNQTSNVNNNKDVVSSNNRVASDVNQNVSKSTHKHNTKPNVAMQYQAGIRETRPKSAKYLSEYQRNFEWMNPHPKESPLMAADQMIHKSNANVAPFIPDKVPRQSEYKMKFKSWSPGKQPVSTHQQQLMDNAEREIKAKYRLKTKSKKSKRSSLTPDKMRPAGVPSVYAHDDLRLLKSAENPTKPFFPHSTTIRRWKSEYASNFHEPELYRYENGIWKGANPPHVAPKDDNSLDKQPKETRDSRPNWFAEVLELRQKAEDYRKRAQGTHFSREHVAQILANQARLWDESSTTTSTVSSLSAPSVDTGLKVRKPNDKPQPVSQPGDSPPVRRRLAWPLNGRNDNKESQPAADDESSIGSIPTPEGYKGSVTPSSDEVDLIEEQGRLPTPRLRDEGVSKRHHLDRTTPATGGAILTSPQPKRSSAIPDEPSPVTTHQHQAVDPLKKTSQQDHRRNIIPSEITRGFAYDSDEDSDDERSVTPRVTSPPPQVDMKTRILNNLQGSPTAGITTRDPFPLRDNTAKPPPFTRHSNNYFETSPTMPVMPKKIEPPRTWAGPLRGAGGNAEEADESGDEEVTATASSEAVGGDKRPDAVKSQTAKGPLNRPNSGSMYGRPMTAHPQTRQEAGTSHTQTEGTTRRRNNEAGNVPSLLPQADPTTPQWRSPVRDSDELSLSTMSIASSSSLASEVLVRARKRRDDFWGKK